MKHNSNVTAVNLVIILLMNSTLKLTLNHMVPQQKVSSSTNTNRCFQPLPDSDQYLQYSQEQSISFNEILFLHRSLLQSCPLSKRLPGNE